MSRGGPAICPVGLGEAAARARPGHLWNKEPVMSDPYGYRVEGSEPAPAVGEPA